MNLGSDSRKNFRFDSAQTAPGGVREIQPIDLNPHLRDVHVIDVRRPDEYVGELAHIAGSELRTLETDFANWAESIPADRRGEPFVFVCRSGQRSGRAAALCGQLGFTNAYNLVGGMIYWNELGLPVEK